MNIVQYFSIISLFLPLIRGEQSAFTDKNKLILKFYNYISANCVIFLKFPEDSTNFDGTLVKSLKFFSRNYKWNNVNEIAHDQYGVEKSGCSAPLIVIQNSQNFWYSKSNFFNMIYEGNRNKNHWNMKVLLFMNSNETISHFFSNIYLPFNSEFYVARYTSSKIIFTEVYRISKTSSLILNDICEQSAYNDFNVKNISLYKRRRNFHGFRFKTSAYMAFPYKTLVQRPKDMDIIQYDVIGNLVYLLQNINNFTMYEIVDPIPIENYSYFDYLFLYEKIDFTSSLFMMTKERTIHSDFLMPISTINPVMIMKHPGYKLLISNFAMPFSNNIWWSILGIIFALTLAAFLIDGCHKPILTIFKYLFHFYSILCFQALSTKNVFVKRLIYLLYFLMHLLSIVITTSYSASFISMITIKKVNKLPFEDIYGLAQIKDYKLEIWKYSGLIDSLKNLENSSLKQYLLNSFENFEELPNTNQEGIHRLCSSNDFKYIFLTSIEIYNYIKKPITCKTIILPLGCCQVHISLTFQYASPYFNLFKLELEQIRENGILKFLFKSLNHKFLDKYDIKRRNDHHHVSFHEFIPILKVFYFGLSIAILVLFLETFYYNLTKIILKYYKKNLI